jgi:predicted membrane-bound spermidine synthase
VVDSWPPSNADLQSFNDDLRSFLATQNQNQNIIPIIHRGFKSSQHLNPYMTTSDDRLLEYGFRKVICDQLSPYQRIQIAKTIDHGNVLILDGAVNLAEKDTIPYTHALMNLPQVREVN